MNPPARTATQQGNLVGKPIALRMFPDEIAALKTLAAAEGASWARVSRDLVLEAMANRGICFKGMAKSANDPAICREA